MPQFGQNLDKQKSLAIERVNEKVGSVRLRFITQIPGQESTYAEKRIEAKEYLALPTEPATLVDYPFIAGAVGVDAPTAYEVAQLWLNLQAQWLQAGVPLENIRRAAVVAVEDAITRPQIDTAVSTLEQTLAAVFPA